MAPQTCERCQSRMVRLVPRRAFRETLLSLLTIYPVCCQLCGHRTLIFWGRFEYLPQRTFSRVPVRYPAWFRPFDRPAPRWGYEGTILDLSVGGCRLEGRSVAPIDTCLRLEFEVSDNEAPVAVEEAVVRAHSSRGMGLAFVKIRKAEKRRIGRIVGTRLANVWPAAKRRLQTRL